MKHTWSSNFEHDGMGNMVFTRCLTHPNTAPLTTYNWPTVDDMETHLVKHEADILIQRATHE